MASDRGSLLALDSFASEEALRVAIYGRALTVAMTTENPLKAPVIASAFMDFVGNDRWRLDALDVALKYVNRRTTTESMVERAEEIAAWVKPEIAEPEPASIPDPDPDSLGLDDLETTPRRKVGAKKN